MMFINSVTFATEEQSYRAFLHNMMGASLTVKQAMVSAVGIPQLIKTEITRTELVYWFSGIIAPIYFDEWNQKW